MTAALKLMTLDPRWVGARERRTMLVEIWRADAAPDWE